jgi:CubicO group peptidase (beta-lactamase class C family)
MRLHVDLHLKVFDGGGGRRIRYARRVALVPLPTQPAGVPWPTRSWPEGTPDPEVQAERLADVLARAVSQSPPADVGPTHALLVVHRGRLVAERYDAEHGPDSSLPSWSMAKSVLHALVGVLVGQRRLDPRAPALVPEWRAGDPRSAITLDQLLRMSSGLRFEEEYTDPRTSNTIQMLFGEGRKDVAAFAAGFPLDHPPGSAWSYSSGTSNIVSAIVGRAVGGGEPGMRAFMQRELLARIGMASADPRFDEAGTWIGSSFLFATARDFARFGLLCLRDGVWEGERLLPEGWVDYARTPTPHSNGEYGAHFWLAQDGSGIFSANGFRGQYTLMVPSRDLVVVRLGTSMPEQKRGTYLLLRDLVEAFPLAARG